MSHTNPVIALVAVLVLPVGLDAGEPSEQKGSAAVAYYPPPESQGGWRKLDSADDIRRIGGCDPIKLDQLKQWLMQSDKRDFAAVVIRRNFTVSWRP